MVRAGTVPLRRAWGRGLVQPQAEMALGTPHSYPSAYREVIEEMGVRLSSVVCGGRITDNRRKFNVLSIKNILKPADFCTDLKTSMLCPCLMVS